MKYVIIKVFSIVFSAALVVACAPALPVKSPETGYCVTGFVGVSVSKPAAFETVMLLDSETERLIRSAETNLTGNYQLCGLAPGRYLIQTIGVTHEIVIRNRSERFDIILDECRVCP